MTLGDHGKHIIARLDGIQARVKELYTFAAGMQAGGNTAEADILKQIASSIENNAWHAGESAKEIQTFEENTK